MTYIHLQKKWCVLKNGVSDPYYNDVGVKRLLSGKYIDKKEEHQEVIFLMFFFVAKKNFKRDFQGCTKCIKRKNKICMIMEEVMTCKL